MTTLSKKIRELYIKNTRIFLKAFVFFEKQKSSQEKSVSHCELSVCYTNIYLIPNFSLIALGRASLCTTIFIVLYLTNVSDAYQVPLYLLSVPHEFFTI